MVSGWVPVVTALAALLGVIVGQFWQARREDVRWKREREERAEQWQREDRYRFAEYKREAYIRFLRAYLTRVSEIRHAFRSGATTAPVAPNELEAELTAELASFDLLSPTELRKAAIALVIAIGRVAEAVGTDEDLDELFSTLRVGELRDLMRNELDVTFQRPGRDL